MNRSKSKGTAWESDIVRALKDAGWQHCERRTLSGANDRGDINVHPKVVIEAKNHGHLNLAAWVHEAEVERGNANADVAVVWCKRRGKAKAEDGYVVMTGAQFTQLLREAGYE